MLVQSQQAVGSGASRQQRIGEGRQQGLRDHRQVDGELRPRRGGDRGPSNGYPCCVPRISYFPVERLDDPELVSYLEHAARYGAPRPESQAIRAHVPAVLRSFSQNWQRTFRTGVVEHSLKELCRVYVSKTIDCHY